MIDPIIRNILDLARWAPSGDNTQPWRFEIIDNKTILVHCVDSLEGSIYGFEGQATQISIGTLLENISISASKYKIKILIERISSKDNSLIFRVHFVSDTNISTDPLIHFIETRSVQRRAFSTRLLTDVEKQLLEKSIGSSYRIKWIEGSDKFRMAWILFKNGKLRLTLPEAFPVHQKIIEWKARFSIDRIPDEAVGLDPVTTILTRWVMKSWGRAKFFNRFVGGSLMPAVQLDLIPGIACASHFALIANKTPHSIDDYVDSGRAVQRFWLTATQVGLLLQPELTPLIFSKYVLSNRKISATDGMHEKTVKIKQELENVLGDEEVLKKTMFISRIGSGKPAKARSLRLSLDQLIIKN